MHLHLHIQLGKELSGIARERLVVHATFLCKGHNSDINISDTSSNNVGGKARALASDSREKIEILVELKW